MRLLCLMESQRPLYKEVDAAFQAKSISYQVADLATGGRIYWLNAGEESKLDDWKKDGQGILVGETRLRVGIYPQEYPLHLNHFVPLVWVSR